MSYARFGSGSDVYVYAHVYGYIECCGCILGDAWDFHSPAEIVDHLRLHVEAGHNVPERLLDVGLYPPEDFVGMCMVHMRREDAGHTGPHTPTRNERDERIRARTLAPQSPAEGADHDTES